MSEFPSSDPPPKTTGGGWRWEPPQPEELQELLPQYEIHALIGRGGMGAVYKGIQLSLDRAVAIKLLPPAIEQQDTAFAERFKNEARLMGRMNHPAIVSVYDFGRTADGQLYFVMEYVDGTDVQRMIAREGKLPPEHALAITAHLCDALGYAHKQGIVHRDIKPSNVLIDMEGRVKVADFGLAKLADKSRTSGITQTGMAMGTPDYVAPETLTFGADVDGRADIYAVGVMLYQMLTGDIPRGMFRMPSQKFQSIDPRFDAIVRRALEHDREERYQSSHELRLDLDVILTTPRAEPRKEAPGPPVQQAEYKPGRTVVPSSRSPGSSPQRQTTPRHPVHEPPPPQKPEPSSTLPYVFAVLLVLGIGGWFIAQESQDPSTTEASAAASASEWVTNRLSQLESEFQAAFEREADAPYTAQMKALDAGYPGSLDRAIQDATKAGHLDDAVALREEKQRFTARKSMPAIDAPGLHEAVIIQRRSYRAEESKYARQKDAASRPLYDRYVQDLATLEKDLLSQGRSADAAIVRTKSEDLAVRRKQSAAKTPAGS
ncbi:serine/threonine-protein kinase [Prosthecobacter sp.]|uniref:serine/threonine-protein kinase n=1 Tax=Prosthecobacter sp. TaxID=1965333 RepID=UPI003782ED59